jgi:hypothetical protein
MENNKSRQNKRGKKTTAALYNNAKLSNSCFETWATEHSLQLNSTKTAVVQFHTPRRIFGNGATFGLR